MIAAHRLKGSKTPRFGNHRGEVLPFWTTLSQTLYCNTNMNWLQF